jgi:hypothetical protein
VLQPHSVKHGTNVCGFQWQLPGHTLTGFMWCPVCRGLEEGGSGFGRRGLSAPNSSHVSPREAAPAAGGRGIPVFKGSASGPSSPGPINAMAWASSGSEGVAARLGPGSGSISAAGSGNAYAAAAPGAPALEDPVVPDSGGRGTPREAGYSHPGAPAPPDTSRWVGACVSCLQVEADYTRFLARHPWPSPGVAVCRT